MGKKYIIHYGNVAGMPYNYARSLDRIGIKSINYMPTDKDSGSLNRAFPYDRTVHTVVDRRTVRIFKKAGFVIGRLVGQSKLVHYYSHTVLRNMMDCRLLHAIGKPMVITFAGTDVRLTAEAKKNNPYFWQMPYSEGDDNIRTKLEKMGRYIRFAATEYETGEYARPFFEKVFLLRQSIDVDIYRYCPPEADNDNPVVLHIPTHREFKGTEFVEKAVERLKSDGLKFIPRLLPPNLTTRQQVRDEIARADIVVDQIRCGAHGVFALEAMASGKPNISFIKDELIEKYPKDLPIVSANPDTIYEVLKELIRDGERRRDVGVKGRAYVEKYHSLQVLGPELKKIYEEIGASFNE